MTSGHARVHDQGTKQAVRGAVPLLLSGVGGRVDGEDGTIPEATSSIRELLQVGVKTSCIPEVQWH